MKEEKPILWFTDGWLRRLAKEHGIKRPTDKQIDDAAEMVGEDQDLLDQIREQFLKNLRQVMEGK